MIILAFNIRQIRTFFLSLSTLAFLAGAANAQDSHTRSITSDDFASQRPASSAGTASGKTPGGRTAKKKPVKYNFVRADKNLLRHKAISKTPAVGVTEKVTEIGVTLWRLRPPQPGEAGFFLPVRDMNNERKMWLAERVADDTIFKAGDKVRFAIESSDAGYLYIFDRESHADGSFGEPLMLFPAKATDDNSVRPGMLFDIPDQREDLPYFNMTPRKENYSGELLTIVISPKPLTAFKTESNGKLKNSDVLAALEAVGEVEIFSRDDREDKVFSEAEAGSTCGVKTRELERERSPDRPCGANSRQLTRDEPLPQSLYRVKGIAGQPAVAFIKLSVK